MSCLFISGLDLVALQIVLRRSRSRLKNAEKLKNLPKLAEGQGLPMCTTHFPLEKVVVGSSLSTLNPGVGQELPAIAAWWNSTPCDRGIRDMAKLS